MILLISVEYLGGVISVTTLPRLGCTFAYCCALGNSDTTLLTTNLQFGVYALTIDNKVASKHSSNAIKMNHRYMGTGND